ncbi:hypothetical protein PLESTB_000004200 [Pleodorina starrii]|uniref:Brix domain-containing protein n=1 Tax=Pleodorina starrii TaxID=330485 RepID=A0A9W6B9U7_9CHLO|nr:hypothetical protein PLESTM_000352700 [Pleodorina starrii]GLC47586.1 hypothetical protein PLESTB_000004200 [Pleodorina starrii]GLC75591.1 hypothetical protein PLESTF_001662900 [Pleodorina starrii]
MAIGGGTVKRKQREEAADGDARPKKQAKQQFKKQGKRGGAGAVKAAADAAANAPAAAKPAPVRGAFSTAITGPAKPVDEGAAAAAAAAPGTSGAFKNKEKVLVLSTRGVTFRYRHLMEDVLSLLPHSKKESKLDTKSDRRVVNEVADLKNCTSVLFFEVRKKQDLYLWLAKSPDGPSVKFHVANVHTMAEVKLSGNHLKGSRPVLSFDAAFDSQPHTQLLKEMLTQVFATPKRHHKAKPFFDHVLSFTLADGRVWVRNYQLVVPPDKKRVDPDNASLVEVGPRFCLNPIKIFNGSFGGATLYDNPDYTSPNAVRAALKRKAASKYGSKVAQRDRRTEHKAQNPLPRSSMEGLFKGEEGDEGDGGSEE